MSDQNTNDDTDEPTTDYLRNEPASSFEAHLFEAGDVADAGGEPGEKSDRPATSVCERSTSYGPFAEVADVYGLTSASETADGGTCAVCLSQARNGDGDSEGDA